MRYITDVAIGQWFRDKDDNATCQRILCPNNCTTDYDVKGDVVVYALTLDTLRYRVYSCHTEVI